MRNHFLTYNKMSSCQEICSDDYMRYVGWNYTVGLSPVYSLFFSPETVRKISQKVTQLLAGVDPTGRPIVVTDRVICHVMSQAFDSRTPKVGDIHTRYIIPDEAPRDDLQTYINRTIETIVMAIKTEFGMIECNSKLSIWDASLMGDFNRKGLRQHPPIKVSEKHPMRMMFNMNY